MFDLRAVAHQSLGELRQILLGMLFTVCCISESSSAGKEQDVLLGRMKELSDKLQANASIISIGEPRLATAHSIGSK